MRNKEQSEIPVNESAKEEVNFITFNVHKIIDATCKNNIYMYVAFMCIYTEFVSRNLSDNVCGQIERTKLTMSQKVHHFAIFAIVNKIN